MQCATIYIFNWYVGHVDILKSASNIEIFIHAQLRLNYL